MTPSPASKGARTRLAVAVFAAWVGVAVGVVVAFSSRDPAPAAAPAPIDVHVDVHPETSGPAVTRRAAGERALEGMTLGPWHAHGGGTDPDAAPLAWAVMRHPDGRRLTIVRVKSGDVQAAVLPSAQELQDAPEVEGTASLAAGRMIASFDLGSPPALRVGGKWFGTPEPGDPALAVVSGALTVRTDLGPTADASLVQGALPPAGAAHTVFVDPGGEQLLIVHAEGVPVAATIAMVSRLGARTIVVIPAVEGSAGGYLYFSDATTKDAPLRRRALGATGGDEEARSLTLDRPQLVLSIVNPTPREHTP